MGIARCSIIRNTIGSKKKVDSELELFFPTLFGNGTAKNISANRISRMFAICDYILGNDEKQKEIDNIEVYLLGFIKPQSFSGSSSFEVQYVLSYEKLCQQLSMQSGGQDIKNMMTLEVYSLMMLLKEKEQQNGRGKSG